MSDEERCRLIAEFEGVSGMECKGNPNVTWPSHDREHPWWRCEHGLEIGAHIVDPPDYAHDLNATMRAARRLPPKVWLVVEVSQEKLAVWLGHAGEKRNFDEWIGNENLARAVFLKLSDYLATRGEIDARRAIIYLKWRGEFMALNAEEYGCPQVGCTLPMPHEHKIEGPTEARGKQ